MAKLAHIFLQDRLYIILILIYSIWPNSRFQVTASDYIKDIIVSTNLVDNNTLQMMVKWKSQITNNTLLDVIVVPHDSIHCKPGNCAVYGKEKHTKEVLIPEVVDFLTNYNECDIKLGCNYTIRVETQRGKLKANTTYAVPICVENVCNCYHQTYYPHVNITANIISNSIVNVSWKIYYPPTQKFEETSISLLKNSSIFIGVHGPKIRKSKYGGETYPFVEFVKPIDFTRIFSDEKIVHGHAELDLSSIPPGSTYYFQSHVRDSVSCGGSEGNYALKVKNMSLSWIPIILGLIIAVVLLALIRFFTAKLICRNKRKRRHIKVELNLMHNEDLQDAVNKYDKFEVFYNNIAITNKYEIGQGFFSRLFIAQAQNLGQRQGKMTVFIKQFKKHPTEEGMDTFLEEITTMKQIGYHDNIVSLLGCCTRREPYIMIMEYFRGEDLLRYLRNLRALMPSKGHYLELGRASTPESFYIQQNHSTPASLGTPVTETMHTMIRNNSEDSFLGNESMETLDHKEVTNFAVQIAKGMRHLEKKQVIQRCLAAKNILIDERKTLKICDYGLCRREVYVNARNRPMIPLRWMSIEAIILDQLYTSKSDVWTFGVVLWEIGTLGGFPYATLANEELVAFLQSGKRLDRPESCSEFLYELMLNCWHEDPDVRPSFNEILIKLQQQNQ